MNPAHPGVSGAVLAGGHSRRMGRDKALLRLGGMTLLERSIRTLQPAVCGVVVAAGEPARYRIPGVRILGDPLPECGPLGGILAALEDSAADAVCVLACDLPFVTTDLIRLLAGSDCAAPVVLPSLGDDRQPLCGRYAVSLKTALRAFLVRGGRTVMDFVAAQPYVCIAVEPGHPVYHPHLLANVNTDRELKEAERHLLLHQPKARQG